MLAEIFSLADQEISVVFADREDAFWQQLLAKQSEFSARGTLLSGQTQVECADLASQEIRIRAATATGLILRTMTAARYTPSDEDERAVVAKIRDLVEQSAHDISARLQADSVVKKLGHWDHVSEQIRESLNRAILEAETAVRRFALAAAHGGAEGAGTVLNISGGQIGAVQTGTYASADVIFNETDKAALIAALAAAREAILAADESVVPDKEEIVAVVDEASTEVGKERPNKIKLGSLLTGIGNAISTTASLRPAWQAVKDAATALYGLLF